MKTIQLLRFKTDEYGSIGEIDYPGARCYVLERQTTGPHPRIPEGEYILKLKPVGSSKFDATAKKFMGAAHRGMIEVTGVPDRSQILIHWGNTVLDSAGCLLVGDSYNYSTVGSGGQALTFFIYHSRVTYRRIYPVLADAILGDSAKLLITSVEELPPQLAA